jgi:hypothetical protein
VFPQTKLLDINTVTNALNNDLKNVSDWLTVNKLSLTKKTEYMIIGSYQRLNLIETDPSIYLGTKKSNELKGLSHWV